ncbi:MAG: hypothetical protein EOO77_08835 [Oxalobacteraceae bacterium]|nr:MAG: hypothetical protein EOO77_08835 [Oxalobacteraceae bacterium]
MPVIIKGRFATLNHIKINSYIPHDTKLWFNSYTGSSSVNRTLSFPGSTTYGTSRDVSDVPWFSYDASNDSIRATTFPNATQYSPSRAVPDSVWFSNYSAANDSVQRLSGYPTSAVQAN